MSLAVILTILSIIGSSIYNQTNRILKEQAIVSTQGILNKNDANFKSAIQYIEDISTYIIFSKDFREYFSFQSASSSRNDDVEEQIKGFLIFHMMSKGYIHSILLQRLNGDQMNLGIPVVTDESGIQKKAIEASGGIYWSPPYQVQVNDRQEQVITLVRVINDINQIDKPIGLVEIRIKESELYNLIAPEGLDKHISMFLLDNGGRVVLHKDHERVGFQHPDARVRELLSRLSNEPNSGDLNLEDNEHYLMMRQIKGTHWVLAGIVNKPMISNELYEVRLSMRNMILVLIILSLLGYLGFYYFDIRRIVELTHKTSRLEKGDFSVRAKVTFRDEIGMLGLRFNKMVAMIQKHIDREYKFKIQQRESELKALQSQINPHFLYNTLDMIRWNARLESAMETSRLIELLSKYFRMNLNQGKIWVKLSDEIKHASYYLELQKKRIGERFHYSIFLESGVEHVIVMKQMLQPLVENSLKHGFERMDEEVRVQIRCYRENKQLCIDIIDNGKGFPQPFGPSEHQGFGMNNIRSRLHTAFGSRADCVTLESSSGAWVRLIIPIHWDETELVYLHESSGDAHEL